MQQRNAELQQQLQNSQEQLRILQEMLKASEQVPVMWLSMPADSVVPLACIVCKHVCTCTTANVLLQVSTATPEHHLAWSHLA